MYEAAPSPRWSTPPSRAAADFAGWSASWSPSDERQPADDLITDLVGHRAHRRRGGRGRRAAAQRRPRGVGQRVRQRPGRAARAAACVPGDGRGADASRRCCASTRRCSCSSGPRPTDVEVGDVVVERGREDRGAARRRQPRPGGLRATPTSSTSTASPTRTWPSGSACTSASARRWPGWSWPSRCGAVRTASPTWRCAGEPESRGTFVLRGFAYGAAWEVRPMSMQLTTRSR